MRVETTVGDVSVSFDTEAETLALTIGRIHIALTTEESADLVEALSLLDVGQLDEVAEVLSTIRASKVS
jgi:hypothetical protein